MLAQVIPIPDASIPDSEIVTPPPTVVEPVILRDVCTPTTLAAGTFVKFKADIAGNAPLSFDAVRVDILASATVPVKLPAGNAVKLAPDPLKVVAVAIPVKNIKPSLPFEVIGVAVVLNLE